MRIQIDTESKFNRGDEIYWLGVDGQGMRYKVCKGKVRTIEISLNLGDKGMIADVAGLHDMSDVKYQIMYVTDWGNRVYEFQAFSTEDEVKENYKNNDNVNYVGYGESL